MGDLLELANQSARETNDLSPFVKFPRIFPILGINHRRWLRFPTCCWFAAALVTDSRQIHHKVGYLPDLPQPNLPRTKEISLSWSPNFPFFFSLSQFILISYKYLCSCACLSAHHTPHSDFPLHLPRTLVPPLHDANRQTAGIATIHQHHYHQ